MSIKTLKTVYKILVLATILLWVSNTLATPVDDFVIIIKSDNPGPSTNTEFVIPTTGSGYNYNVDCDNDGINEGAAQTGNFTCNYALAGTYTLRIKDNSGTGTGFPRIFFSNVGDREKILDITQWGTGQWTSMERAFSGTPNLLVTAIDTPDFSAVADMSFMFFGATSANPNTSNWNTSSVTNMAAMFEFAIAANPDTSGWDTTTVTSMSNMFIDATSANPDTSNWNTAAVTTMNNMFQNATSATPDTSGWDVTALTNANNMFAGVTLPTTTYDALLIAWSTQALQTNVTFNAGNSRFCTAGAARTTMINAPNNWTIIDDGLGCSVDLAITKTLDTTAPYIVGTTIQYTLLVSNNGSDIATNAVISDTPSNLNITSVSSTNCTAVPCTIPSLANGASETITVLASIIAAGAFDNSTSVTANEPDPNDANNTDNTNNGGNATVALPPAPLAIPTLSPPMLLVFSILLLIMASFARKKLIYNT